MADENTLREDVFAYVRAMMAENIVDLELDMQHYDAALDQGLAVFRQLASNAQEESYAFLNLVQDQQEYTLDDNIMVVRQVFRRGIGSGANSNATQFEPFEAGYINTYLMQSGRVGGLATYELFSGYQELAARMFGGYINFTWEPVSKKLTVVRKINGSGETVMLWVYNKKPNVTLLQDQQVIPWIRKYTLGACKQALGAGRGKFSTVVGPGGGTTLDGDTLRAEGAELIQSCHDDINNYVVGNDPMYFRIG